MKMKVVVYMQNIACGVMHKQLLQVLLQEMLQQMLQQVLQQMRQLTVTILAAYLLLMVLALAAQKRQLMHKGPILLG